MDADRNHPVRSRHEINSLIRRLTREQVEAALRRLQAGEQTPFSESTTYDVEFGSGKFPPKRVIGLALEELTGEVFTPYDFIGGVFSASFRRLEELQFRIVDKQGSVRGSRRLHTRGGKYGELTWQIVLDAVGAFRGGATRRQVSEHLAEHRPEFNLSNVDPDLNLLTVNSPSRGNFHPNRRPRRCDQGSRYDALFRIGSGNDSKYIPYQPAIHGVWELAALAGSEILRPRPIELGLEGELSQARERAVSEGAFDVLGIEDARRRVLATIVRRQGQPAFRDALMVAYEGRCAITSCDVPAALEAAHIAPYLGPKTNHVQNGLLLRADIHTLFDLNLLTIDAATMSVNLAAGLEAHYSHLQGQRLRLPPDQFDWPSVEAIATRSSLVKTGFD